MTDPAKLYSKADMADARGMRKVARNFRQQAQNIQKQLRIDLRKQTTLLAKANFGQTVSQFFKTNDPKRLGKEGK